MGQLAMQPHYYKFWRELIKPKGFEVEKETLTSRYGKFHVRPLERGFGVTLGNSLRRVLLSSMMGSAVSAVKFEGVLHEFSTLPDVLEDVTDIILNLKEVRFRQFDPETKVLRISKTGPGKVTAGDIQLIEGIEVLENETHLVAPVQIALVPGHLRNTVSEAGHFAARRLIERAQKV